MVRRTLSWRCPKCGRSFANRNQWHSCGRFRVADHLTGASPEVLELYRRFERIVRSCGSVTLTPTKDRIRFRALVQFASAQPQRNALRVGLVLGRRLSSPRIQKISTFTPGRHVHAMKIREPDELDSELRHWVQEAYELGRLRGPASGARPARKA